MKLSNNINSIKIPIKYNLGMPRIKIKEQIINFGEIKERQNYQKIIIIENKGQRNVKIQFDVCKEIQIYGVKVLNSNSCQKFKVVAKFVKFGNIKQIIRIKFFQKLYAEVKVVAICRASSIRTKKINNLNTSRQPHKLYQTISQINLTPHNQTLTNFYTTLNSNNEHNRSKDIKTDLLSQIRAQKVKKIKLQLISKQQQILVKEPTLKMNLSALDLYKKTNNHIKRYKLEEQNKLTLKQQQKYAGPLSMQQLQNIKILQNQINLGNIFIDTQISKDIKIINKNAKTILFQWKNNGYDCFKHNRTEIYKIQPLSQKFIQLKFNPDMIGVILMPLQYVINKMYPFQINVTAYVSLVNLQVSNKDVEFHFGENDTDFQKSQEIQLKNKGNSKIKAIFSFAQKKHFYVQDQSLTINPKNSTKIKIFYRPIQQTQSGFFRQDYSKLIIKVIDGGQNIIKCKGTTNDAKISIKENQICFLDYLISTPIYGKLNLRNHSKIEAIYMIQIGPQLANIISIDKQSSVLSSDEKKQINYTLLCHEAKKIISYLYLHTRGGKSFRIHVELSFIIPQLQINKPVIDFGNIPIMGSNYQQILIITNLYKNEIKVQQFKPNQDQDYIIEIRQIKKIKTEHEIKELQEKVKKLTFKKDQNKEKDKKVPTNKIFKLLPNVQMSFQLKFIPKKFQNFNIPIPLRLCGTQGNTVQPVNVNLICCGIEPVVYLRPQKLLFESLIIGQGKSSYGKRFQIRNPHEYDIDWYIQLKQHQRHRFFFFSEDNGRLLANESVHIEVLFHPQQEGHFCQRFNVVLKQKKISHISLQLQGRAIFPSIKFNCNEILMPIVPLGIQSKYTIILQNHGYDAITISKWKTSNTFQNVDINVNFKQGKLLSLAKQHLKVQITVKSKVSISFTTFLQFYDEFGNNYDIQLSVTVQNSIMTVYPYLQTHPSVIVDRRQNCIQLQTKALSVYEESNPLYSLYRQKGCEFIKNWLNYEINLNIKHFPQDLIKSQGQIFMKMVNKMSSIQLAKKYYSNHQNILSLYNYYADNIKILKAEGAFLNQIRPQYLLEYKDYKVFIHSKNAILYQEKQFNKMSVFSWMILFYQLAKLYIIPQITDKMISKFSISTNNLTSNIYSSSELQIFRFLNFFSKDKEEAIYTFNDQIKFLQCLQRGLQKILKINFTKALLSIQVANGVMTPSIFLNMISKFLYQKLKEYGLNLYLQQADLLSLGMKQLMIYLVSFIKVLSSYNSSSLICYQASIGDKINKVIQIQNPLNKKINYRIKLIGSTQFKYQPQTIMLNGKSKCEVKILYHCKQNKDQEGFLLLIPVKEDISSAVGQPLAFKMTTSIFSKITIKKLQIEAKLYEITNLCLQVELPVQLTQLTQFNVTINENQGQGQTFYCFNQLKRALKINHDKLNLKIIPLLMKDKKCKICYRSIKYGQFYIQINCKIILPQISKQIKLKQLKINKQQILKITIPKQNEQLCEIFKFWKDYNIKNHHEIIKKPKNNNNKYNIILQDNNFINVNDYTIWNSIEDRKQYIDINLKCNFDRPFNDYRCNLIIKAQNGEQNKDIRYFKLIASVATSPTIISMTIKAKSRESTMFKVPIVISPCTCIIQNNLQDLNILNYSPLYKQNTDLNCIFSPQWMNQRQVSIITQNSETLEQMIYEIQLIGQEPSFFDTIKLQASEIFTKKIKIPLNKLDLKQKCTLLINSKRLTLQTDKYISNQKYINAIIHPSIQSQQTSLKILKQNSSHFYHCCLSIINKTLKKIQIKLQQKPLYKIQYLIKQIPLNNDYLIKFDEQQQYLKWSIKQKQGINYINLIFEPNKEMQYKKHLYVMLGNNQYNIQILCKSPQLPPILLPEIYTFNLKSKNSTFNLINPSNIKGNYTITTSHPNIIRLQNNQYQFKQKQKKQIYFTFHPNYLNLKYKIIIKCQSNILPKYQYILHSSSDYKYQEKDIFYQYMIDKQNYKEIFFKNCINKTEEYTIEKDNDNFYPFQIIEPIQDKFSLQAGEVKKIIIKHHDVNKIIDVKDTSFLIRVGQRKWKYNIIPILIKQLSNKKYHWICKARQTIIENIQLPDINSFKDIQSSSELSSYISYSIEEGTNHLKIKFNPTKPITKGQYHLYLLCQQQKYAINMFINVTQADFDDKIIIKTKQINQIGCVSFKLTNIKKNSTPFKAYFMKGYADLKVELEKNLLEGYGKPGTTIYVKFASNVYNKKVQDQLYIETNEMLWRFKVKGIVSKTAPKN